MKVHTFSVDKIDLRELCYMGDLLKRPCELMGKYLVVLSVGSCMRVMSRWADFFWKQLVGRVEKWAYCASHGGMLSYFAREVQFAIKEA